MSPISSFQLTRIVLSVALLSAAIAYVIARGDWATFAVVVSGLSWLSLVIPSLLMLAGALLASLRLQFIARDLGYSLHFRDAVAALGIGQLAGSLFFQV